MTLALSGVLLGVNACRAPEPAPAPPRAAGTGGAATGFPPHAIAHSQVRPLPRGPGQRAYQLHVGLPDSYDASPERRYPVLYICDGYWDFPVLSGIRGNLVYDKAAPEFIIVGFGYPGDHPDYGVLRRWDYTPVPEPARDAQAGASGHAAEFLAAVEQEIIPFIEREYRADAGYRVLGGSSLGGLFALYVLLERPSLFQAYIAPSPAVPWSDGWLFHREEELAKQRQRLPARLFMSGAAAEDPSFLKGIEDFDRQLRGRAYADLVYEWRLIDGERHAGTKAESYNRGVRFAFAPLAPRPSEK